MTYVAADLIGGGLMSVLFVLAGVLAVVVFGSRGRRDGR